jgi:hypothetical protein
MTSSDRQRRDGSAKRVQLTSGDHSGPGGKRRKRTWVSRPDKAQRAAAAKREWAELFRRLDEMKKKGPRRKDGV